MAVLGNILNAVGALLLTHAVYSTHEHANLSSHTPLPTDVTLELLVSIFLLSTGIVISSQALRPIQNAQWAGQLSREGPRTEGERTREGEEIVVESDPYAFLGLDSGFGKGEGRKGFFDVRGKRREYEDWVRAGSKQ